MRVTKAQKLTEGVNHMPPFIENPNSSGQGFHAEHADHPYHAVLSRSQYRYSHSTPIRKNGIEYALLHTYKHLDMKDHVVGIYQGKWEAGKLGRGRQTHGDNPEGLDRFLKGHLRRAVKGLD